MGFLKKMIKKPFKDVKKVAKVVTKVDPIARTGMKLDPIARKVTGVGQKRRTNVVNQNDTIIPRSSRTPSGYVGYSTGQGNAPTPQQYTPTPPIGPTLRKNTARKTMSTMGAGKYRVK